MAVTEAKEEIDYTIKPEAGANNISTADWPLLLKNYDKRMLTKLHSRIFLFSRFLCFIFLSCAFWAWLFSSVTDSLIASIVLTRTGHFTPIPAGCSPLKRDLKSYINSGVINLDKPSNPSSHEVVAWMKRILR